MGNNNPIIKKKSIKRSAVLSPDERLRANVLIVDSQVSERTRIRQTLTGLGFASYVEASEHATGITRLQERPITHVIFQASATNMSASEFLTKIMEIDDNIIAVPTSSEPRLDDVFQLLSLGARGYLLKPFTGETLEDSLNWATHGEPISEAILFAKDRNEALSSLVMSNLDRLAHTMRQARQFETAIHELGILQARWRKSVEMAMLFGKGGPAGMQQYFIEFAVERAQGPASALGRFRKRLASRKAQLAEKAEKRKLLEEIQELTAEANQEKETS
jgi:two-component system chemotaxis response regulator CheY